MHEAHLRFNHDVVAGSVAVWSCLAIARYRGVDEGGIDGAEDGVVHGVFRESSWKIVLDQDIAGLSQRVEYRDAGWMSEGETNGLLVPVYLR